MKDFLLLTFWVFILCPIALRAQSSLLETVKQNPKESIALCNRFKVLNSEGISASSKIAIQEIAAKRNLRYVDAEILSMYVIGLNCPDVQ